MGVGAIPWDKIELYADRNALEPDVARLFVVVIRGLDQFYLEKQEREREERRQREERKTKLPRRRSR